MRSPDQVHLSGRWSGRRPLRTRDLIFAAVLLLYPSLPVSGQAWSGLPGEIVVARLATAPFPHPLRDSGHTYQGRHFPADAHYRDNTVLVFIAEHFRASEPADIVVHIHGWYNNVDSALAQFSLARQVAASGRNALLVVVQGPKNAPDSFGGKLEAENGFRDFTRELDEVLRAHHRTRDLHVRSYVLSGHSGAYRMISFILMRGGRTAEISEVYLFDGLYGQLEKFSYWLDRYRGRFVAIYTDDGGTKSTTEALMEDLRGWGIPYVQREESVLTDDDLRTNRIVFVHTDLGHNEVIAGRRQLEQYLRTGTR